MLRKRIGNLMMKKKVLQKNCFARNGFRASKKGNISVKLKIRLSLKQRFSEENLCSAASVAKSLNPDIRECLTLAKTCMYKLES